MKKTTKTTAKPSKETKAEVAITPEKEVEELKQSVQLGATYAQALKVLTPEDRAAAIAEGLAIKGYGDRATKRKEEITKPLNAALASARALFKPVEDAADTAVRLIKSKIVAYDNEERAAALKKQQALVDRVDRGTMKEETAERKALEIVEPEKTTHIATGKSTTTTRIEYVVEDKTKIPYIFLVPDMVAIKAAFKMGNPVPGVKAETKTDINFSNY